MNWFGNVVKRFLEDEDGPTAVEYAVMLSFVIIVCILAVQNIGKATSSNFQSMANSLSS